MALFTHPFDMEIYESVSNIFAIGVCCIVFFCTSQIMKLTPISRLSLNLHFNFVYDHYNLGYICVRK